MSSNKLLFHIIKYLRSVDGAAEGFDQESLDVAIECLADAVQLDVTDQKLIEQYDHKDSLLDVYNKATGVSAPVDDRFTQFVEQLTAKGFFNGCTKGDAEYNKRLEAAKAKYFAKHGGPANSKADPVQLKARADAIKGEGNKLLQAGKNTEAALKYGEAITVLPHAVYHSNRAQAYLNLKQYDDAIADCKSAIALDSEYAKAYYRLGSAYVALKDYDNAIAAYETAITKAGKDSPFALNISEQLKQTKAAKASASSGGGMPDLAGLMNNPMLQQMMAGMGGNGGGGPDLAGLMSNPAIQQMMASMGGGGGPDMSGLQAMMAGLGGGNNSNNADTKELEATEPYVEEPEDEEEVTPSEEPAEDAHAATGGVDVAALLAEAKGPDGQLDMAALMANPKVQEIMKNPELMQSLMASFGK